MEIWSSAYYIQLNQFSTTPILYDYMLILVIFNHAMNEPYFISPVPYINKCKPDTEHKDEYREQESQFKKPAFISEMHEKI
jgi:hypothetical protein